MANITAGYMQMDAGHWFSMALGFLVLAALLLWLGATLAGNRHRVSEAPSEETSAVHLLDRRLAQGEITAEEREHVRDILAGKGAGTTT